ncbi:MAG TPA: MarR family transcriptional regulator [Aliidongia sp.]|uniref:MarR family winged helix-turn-helix transcriptional regulator n=1 Tax=Aliidongia sp. TaxID=1914230 RepID=UPI002DDD413C|nr:MarR family transcriptional regulator [Aliidongia sp.]HEV2678056.1 MarR family transcriptional regulator [Aliidongia sp.]
MPDEASTDQLLHTLGFLMHDVARMHRKRFEQRARAARFDLTRAQYSVLAHLSRHEGCNQSFLAQILEIEPITLMKQLDRLEELALIERRAAPADRRTRHLHLTAAARPLLDRIHEISKEVREEALAGIAAVDRQRLWEILSAMKLNLAGRVDMDLASAPVEARGTHG